MASYIYIGLFFPDQEPCHETGVYNLKEDIRVCCRNGSFDTRPYQVVIAKGNIIEGVEANA